MLMRFSKKFRSRLDLRCQVVGARNCFGLAGNPSAGMGAGDAASGAMLCNETGGEVLEGGRKTWCGGGYTGTYILFLRAHTPATWGKKKVSDRRPGSVSSYHHMHTVCGVGRL